MSDKYKVIRQGQYRTHEAFAVEDGPSNYVAAVAFDRGRYGVIMGVLARAERGEGPDRIRVTDGWEIWRTTGRDYAEFTVKAGHDAGAIARLLMGVLAPG